MMETRKDKDRTKISSESGKLVQFLVVSAVCVSSHPRFKYSRY